MQASRCLLLSAARMVEIDFLSTSHSHKHLPQIVRSSYPAMSAHCSVQRSRVPTLDLLSGSHALWRTEAAWLPPTVREKSVAIR